jgi:hypothetical protein
MRKPILALILALTAAFGAPSAHAFVEARGGDFYTGGAMAQYQMQAFGGYGYSYGYGTGQWGGPANFVDMTPVYVSNLYNWSGAQPMGVGSYLPPMGIAAIGASQGFGAFGYGITPWTFGGGGAW